MSPSRGPGSWKSDSARTDWQPGYGQLEAPNAAYDDYQFSSRDYQDYHYANGRTSDAFYGDGYDSRFSRYDYADHYADSSRMPERRPPDYAEYHRGEGRSSYGAYEGGSFADRWAESERDFRASSRPLDYSSASSSRRSYDSPPPGSRRYHSSARDYDGSRETRRSGYDDYRQQDTRRGDAFEERDSYSNYRRPPPREDHIERHTSFRSRSPNPRSHPLPSRPSPGPPPPPKRTNPTSEYIEISHQPPSHLLDPALSRKLIVLDLNGTLVLRGAHTGRAPGRPFDNPTQPRLRPVHPRPYLKTFATYLLHDETKKWLNTMVWSSAQPHSVQDMVGKAFLERKDELTAVWARDTLGLTTEEYHSKSLTMKDLAKPWAELPTLQASYLTEELPTTKAIERIDSTDPRPQHHSALSSLLVDDSPLKAALQPWNHLCIREYVQEMRREDLVVAEQEAARERMRKAIEEREASEKKLEEERAREKERLEDVGAAGKGSEDTGSDPVRRVIHEVLMVGGEMVRTAEVVKRVSREVVMIEGQMITPEEDPAAPALPKLEMKKVREDKEREAFELSKQETEAAGSRDAADAEGKGNTSMLDGLAKDLDLRYDETLLAVIGVLDQIKHESNVAGWMRSGGLLRIAHPPTQLSDDGRADQLSKAEKHPAPSRDQSPSGQPSPTKKRRLDNKSDESDAELEIQPPPPSSPPSNILSSPRVHEADLTTPSVDENEPIREEVKKEQASTGIPLSPPPPLGSSTQAGAAAVADVGPKDLWYQDPVVHTYWANRGRRALAALGIGIESGVEPIPGGLAPLGK
ncbi:hypothetical protein M413DRAFT_423204 [Hebeloma cylindrosporum]|uniref:FCP1 homology domain-containing protein n=1 Tax=Hebeloma cylindrosporum TaxID=76867 RepID=A0A0C3BL08_HEBCY|nr:hypothetical protein M413DRAFT_423204 [Hebeloma cylindrosporum h7]